LDIVVVAFVVDIPHRNLLVVAFQTFRIVVALAFVLVWGKVLGMVDIQLLLVAGKEHLLVAGKELLLVADKELLLVAGKELLLVEGKELHHKAHFVVADNQDILLDLAFLIQNLDTFFLPGTLAKSNFI
jgi:hypothetical protein